MGEKTASMDRDKDSDEDTKNENDNCVNDILKDVAGDDGDDAGAVATAVKAKADVDEDKKSEPEEEEEDANGVPVDRGWAWMVNLAAFVTFLVFYSQGMLLSVLITDIIDHFQTSLATITIMLACNCLGYSVGCQLSVNLLVPRMSVRKLFVSTATLNAACTFLLMLAPNMAVFFAVHVFKSLVHGLTLMPILTLVGHYFKRRRALASSLTLLGNSSASLFSPLFVRYLIGEYGWQGCFLLWGGFEMQAIVATSLLRPLSSYKTRRSKEEKNTDKTANKQTITTNHRKEFDRATIYKNKEGLPIEHHRNGNGCDQNGHISDHELEEQGLLSSKTSSDAGRQAGSWSGRLHSSGTNVKRIDLNRTPPNLHGDNKQLSQSSNALDSIRKPKQSSLLVTDTTTSGTCRQRTRAVDNNAHNFTSLEFLNRIDLGSSLMSSSISIAEAEVERVSVVESETSSSSAEKHESAGSQCRSVMKTIFNVSALRSLDGVFYIISYCLGRSVALIATYLPAYGEEVGLDKTKAALLLTLFGAVDTISRVIFGFIGDLHLVRPKYIIAVSAVCTGIIACFANLYTTFPLLVVCSTALGFFGCVSLSLNTNNIIDLHGLDKLGTFLSQASLLLSFTFMVQFPIIGIIVESTGTLVSVFLYVAVCYFASATLTLLYSLGTRIVSSGRKSSGTDAQITEALDTS